MKSISTLATALLMGFCLQPHSLFAEDQPDSEQGHHQAPAAHQSGNGHQTAGNRQREDRGGNNVAAGARASKRGHAQAGQGFAQRAQAGNRSQPRTGNASNARSRSVQGNRSNRYNGQWVSASMHRDWDPRSEHQWNHHSYRYYDGGWLLINFEPAPVYSGDGSVQSQVQERLASGGFYDGPIDGYIGPQTRAGIANYQGSNGLEVTGTINQPLLISMGLN